MADKKHPETGSDTHRATQRGYAGGDIIEEGEAVPAGIPVSKEWMRRTDGKEDHFQDAIAAALDPLPDDVDYTKLDKAALQALATDKGIPVDGLSKDQLVTAIKAAHDPKR